MRPYRFATPAFRDLTGILEYLSQNSTLAASRFVIQLDQRLRLLARYPHMGVRRDDFGHPHLRFVMQGPYFIAYDPESKPLTVIALRHSSRDPESFVVDPTR